MHHTLPQHIAIIMDGNGRWAQQRGMARTEGHKAGVQAARAIVTECRTLGINYLTLYTFSRENWNRPREEVALLFSLLVQFLTEEVPNMIKQSIRLNILGEVGELPLAARTAIQHAVRRTQSGTAMVVNLALNYGGRDEIVRAARKLIEDGVAAQDVTEESLRKRLYTGAMPDPDLVIRTSGEIRVSNYLLFQCAYSEFFFTPVLWPDFTPEILRQTLEDFGTRNRRFGKTQEQLA
ncbi:MAG: isoprenyl transferase [Desulfovibrionaceae bacterium]